MDQNKVKTELLKMNCDWMEFNFNAPAASHMGGVWERQIKTVRSVLSALLEKNGVENLYVRSRSSDKQPSTHNRHHNLTCLSGSLDPKSPTHHED